MKYFLMKNKLTLLFTACCLFFFACDDPKDVISATHYTRVPKASNLSFTYDTTVTGLHAVTISWNASSTLNLKNFEIYKAVNKPLTFFPLPNTATTTSIVDSFAYSIVDTLKMYYYIVGIGQDRFVGESSEILYVPITK